MAYSFNFQARSRGGGRRARVKKLKGTVGRGGGAGSHVLGPPLPGPGARAPGGSSRPEGVRHPPAPRHPRRRRPPHDGRVPEEPRPQLRRRLLRPEPAAVRRRRRGHGLGLGVRLPDEEPPPGRLRHLRDDGGSTAGGAAIVPLVGAMFVAGRFAPQGRFRSATYDFAQAADRERRLHQHPEVLRPAHAAGRQQQPVVPLRAHLDRVQPGRPSPNQPLRLEGRRAGLPARLGHRALAASRRTSTT